MSDPTDADLLQRLLDGDPVASADLAGAYLPLLTCDIGWARGTGRSLDQHIVETAAQDAVLGLIANPRQYDPTRMPLLNYLRMSARGDLKNALAREARHARRSAPLESVDFWLAAGNSDGEDDRVELPGGLSAEAFWRAADADLVRPEDRKAARMMFEDEIRETEPFARLYNLDHLPPTEQRREVKRQKDRIKIRLKRLGDRLRDQR